MGWGGGNIHERVWLCIRAIRIVFLGHLLLAIVGDTVPAYMHLRADPAEPFSYVRVPNLLLHTGILESGLP